MEKKFGLVASMMKRLEVTPCVITLLCLKNSKLSFDCCVKGNSAGVKLKNIKISDNCLENNPIDEKTDDVSLLNADTSISASNAQPDVLPNTLFYEDFDNAEDEEFELSCDTIASVRCGMFAYAQGEKIVVRRLPMSVKQIQTRRCVFKGVLFKSDDDYFGAVKIGKDLCGYNRAVKKLSSGYRMPTTSECEVMFVYQNSICSAFKLLHINLRNINRFFCSNVGSKDFNVFVLNNGTFLSPSEISSAGSFQVCEIKKYK